MAGEEAGHWYILTIKDIDDRNSNFWKSTNLDLFTNNDARTWIDLKRHKEELVMLKQELQNWKENIENLVTKFESQRLDDSKLDIAKGYLAMSACRRFQKLALAIKFKFDSEESKSDEATSLQVLPSPPTPLLEGEYEALNLDTDAVDESLVAVEAASEPLENVTEGTNFKDSDSVDPGNLDIVSCIIEGQDSEQDQVRMKPVEDLKCIIILF